MRKAWRLDKMHQPNFSTQHFMGKALEFQMKRIQCKETDEGLFSAKFKPLSIIMKYFFGDI